MKFGLDNIIRLAALLGNPHESFLSVHIAGTNGKGPTSAMIASILRHAGFRVGLFTSPHLVNFTERIRINGAEIEEREVIDLTDEIREIVAQDQDTVGVEVTKGTGFVGGYGHALNVLVWFSGNQDGSSIRGDGTGCTDAIHPLPVC